MEAMTPHESLPPLNLSQKIISYAVADNYLCLFSKRRRFKVTNAITPNTTATAKKIQ